MAVARKHAPIRRPTHPLVTLYLRIDRERDTMPRAGEDRLLLTDISGRHVCLHIARIIAAVAHPDDPGVTLLTVRGWHWYLDRPMEVA